MKLIRLTKVDDGIDIVVNTAHIVFIEISEDGSSAIALTTGSWVYVEQSFNEIILLGAKL